MMDRRPATPEEAKAMAHPLRLRILRLCLDADQTNKELANALGKDPGTVLHHVRMLVDGGFLAAGEPRRGRRGSRERPYRATGKSWHLDFGPHEQESTGRAMVAAFGDELAEAVDALGGDAILELTRMGIRLRPSDRDELLARLRVLAAEFFEREDVDGEPLALFLGLHRRPCGPRPRDGEMRPRAGFY